MRSGTAESTGAWAVTSLEINIDSPSRNSKEDAVHFLQDSSDA